MEVGVISDIHGNRIALEAVLDDMPDVDALCCAGDIVGYGPWPAACVAFIRDRDVPTVMGNHDRAVTRRSKPAMNSMANAGVQYAKHALSDDQLSFLATLPDQRVEFDGQLKLVHGHPSHPDRYTYPQSFGPNLLEDETVLVMGHTHIQHFEQYDEGIVMNPGSVGQPRDGDPKAAYAVVNLDALSVTEHRVDYDIEAVRSAVEEAGLPPQIGDRLRQGR